MNIKYLKQKARKVLDPLERYGRQCHAASIALVQAGIGDRVARGTCPGVGGQHSWVVIGDPYRPTLIIDPTLWSYDSSVKGIWVGVDHGHRPFGAGQIWDWGKPCAGNGPIVPLTPKVPFSQEAKLFLEMLGPLDERGWSALTKAPVGGWPASEIIAAIDDTEQLSVFVPIDILGMVTDRNPGGLYLKN